MGSSLSILIVATDQEEVFHIIRELKSYGFSPLYQIISNKEEWKIRIFEEDWDAVLVSYHWNKEGDELELLKDIQTHGLDIPFIILAAPEDNAKALALMHVGAADIIDKKSLFRLTQVLERERRELIFL